MTKTRKKYGYRIVNGKKYYYYTIKTKKAIAEHSVRNLRKQGWSAIIRKTSKKAAKEMFVDGKIRYIIYRRKRGR